MKMTPKQFPAHRIQEAKANHEYRLVAGLEGEKLVYEQLKAADIPGFAVHSLSLRQHQSKIKGELDFLVCTEDGVFALEVKSGKNYELRENTWYDGETEQKESPWDQAEGNCFSIRDMANKYYPESKNLIFGWGVVLPRVKFKANNPMEVHKACVLDQPNLNSSSKLGQSMACFLKQLAAYHKKRMIESKGESFARHKRALNKKDFDELKQIFARPMDLSPSIGGMSLEHQTRLIHPSYEQYSMIESMCEDRIRAVVEGGAGTGKTYIAVKVLEARSEEGQHCALLVQSRGLARHLKNVSAGKFDVFSIEDISASTPPYDYIAVDEGQDITTAETIDLVESLTKKSIAKSQWGWFMDSNNQKGLHDKIDPVALGILKEYGWPKKIAKNARNTKEVVTQVKQVLEMDLGSPNPEASGPKTTYETWSREDAQDKFQQKVKVFFNDENLEPGDLSIVYVGESSTFLDGLVELLPPKLKKKIRYLNKTDHDHWPPKSHAIACTPKEIKGLENKATLVVVAPDLCFDDVTLEELYVSFTRPTSVLWIMTGTQLQNELRERLKRP